MSETIPVKRKDIEEWRRVLESANVCVPPGSRIANYTLLAAVRIGEYLKKEDNNENKV